jgi:hypothetical protein
MLLAITLSRGDYLLNMLRWVGCILLRYNYWVIYSTIDATYLCVSPFTRFILFHYMFRLLLSHLHVQFQYSVPRVRIIIVQCAFYNYTLISYMIQTPS